MDQPPAQPPAPPPPPPPPPPPGGPAIVPRTLGEILGDAFRLYGQNWQTLVAIAAVVVVPIAFIGTFIRHTLTKSVTSVIHVNHVTGTVTYTHATGAFYRGTLGSLVLLFLSIFVTGLLTGAITRAVLSETAGLPVDLGDSYTFALSRVGAIIWVSILFGLTVAVGFLLFFIPGIWLFGMLFASVIVVVSENVRGTAAMGRSWNLVSGHWWHTFGTIFVAALLSGVVSGILQAPFRQWVAQAIASALAQTITLPFTTVVGVLLYIDLRARKEGLSTERLRADLQTSA